MSQNFEDSPVSDNRMDISETTTTSQESTGVSPTTDNVPQQCLNVNEYTTVAKTAATTTDDTKTKSNNSTTNNSSINRALYSNTTTTATTMMSANNKNGDCDNDGNGSDILKLDNEPSTNVLRLGRQQPQQNLRSQTTNCNSLIRSSELKVANSHPLMSPQGSTDSDSENNSHHHHNHNHHTNKHRIFSYPDVVPENEPLRLVNNITITAATTTTTTKQLIKNHQNLDVTVDCTTKNSIAIDPVAITGTTIATTTTTIDKSSDRISVLGNSQKRKISVRRESSPDLISSESDPDISQYQASVEPNYQSVTLISNNLNRITKTTTTTQLSPLNKPLTRRKIPIPTDLLSDDMSSLDSISNHSFDDDDDDDMEHNLASLSPSSSVLDGFNDKYDDFPEIETPTNVISPPLLPDPIPQYSAEDERRDSRNWQKITLPDGRVREIDMKVIEPYKRVLSHGGYLKAGGHNAIVMFCACHLPDRSRADYHYVMDNLFLYVVKTLEQLVTEDYVLIYLHGGSSRRNVPPFPWLKKCYQLLDRRLRKSLKNLYLVHPSFWLKSVVWMSRPFVSSKFWRKLVYVRSLEELYTLVSVEKAAIPDKVKQYDAKYS